MNDTIKIGLLTSSRADYGIYRYLLKQLKSVDLFEITLIAFGSHLSVDHGYTLDQILEDKYFDKLQKIETIPDNDSSTAIGGAIGNTIINFVPLWGKNEFDLVFCLGDRYEMFAACASSIPFNTKLAHISGGEQTTGAIDDIFRHSITHMSSFHFTTTEKYKRRVIELKGSGDNVYNAGALNIDSIKNTKLLSIKKFEEEFKINLRKPSILVTFHPETVNYRDNVKNVKELVWALKEISGYQIIITMPNADTMGNVIRKHLVKFIRDTENAIGVESFGSEGYLSCMKHCSFMLGNTSSGFVEASYFSKYVINLGERQNGRILTPNIKNCPIEKTEILEAVSRFDREPPVSSEDIYGKGLASTLIIDILKKYYEKSRGT